LAYAGPAGQAVRRFKYRGSLAAGAELAGLIARRTPAEYLAGAELLLPVPLHPWRLLRRGFNQACVLFRPLARRHGRELAAGLLRRRRHTRPQVGLDAAARRENVAGAFDLARGTAARVRGRQVLLVDDVFTTGATAAECARVLKEAGAAWVGVFTLVRARGHPGGGLRPEAGPDMIAGDQRQ
jgi:ComF family protein